MSTVEDMAQAAKLAYGDVNQAAYAVGKGAYQRAQNAGMRFQNWRHKGAGEEGESALETAPNSARMDGQTLTPRKPGKNWTTDEESFKNTSYSETTYTRKRTR